MGILRSRAFHITLGAAVSVALCVYVFYDLNWTALSGAVSNTQWWVFLPATVVFIAHHLLRALRWKYLLPADAQPGIADLFSALMIGNLATFTLPLRAGEIVRPFALSRRCKVTFPRSFASVIIERFFDLAFVLLSFGVLLKLLPGLPAWSYQGAQALAILAAGILVFMCCGAIFPSHTEALVRKILGYLPPGLREPLTRISTDFFLGAKDLRDPKNIIMVVGLTALVWCSCYIYFFLCLWLLPIAPSMLLAVSVAVVVALAVAAPSAPGFVGVYQVGCVAAFALFDVMYETGVAYSLLTHLHQYIVIVLLGIAGLMRFGLGVRDLSHAAHVSPTE